MPAAAKNCPITEFHMTAVAVASPNAPCDATKNSFTGSENQAC